MMLLTVRLVPAVNTPRDRWGMPVCRRLPAVLVLVQQPVVGGVVEGSRHHEHGACSHQRSRHVTPKDLSLRAGERDFEAVRYRERQILLQECRRYREDLESV